MKKLLTACIITLFTVVSIAPNLTDLQRKDLNKRLWTEHLRLKYEVELIRFTNYLGFKESRNNWMAINSIGYFGEWQFGRRALKHLGYGHITLSKFKTDPSIFPRDLQLKVLKDLMKINSIYLKEYECFIGTAIKGTIISKAGMLAAAHLGGAGSVKLYLMSIGKIDRKDLYGTRVSDYFREFSMYNL